jgi:hypothetical protein
MSGDEGDNTEDYYEVENAVAADLDNSGPEEVMVDSQGNTFYPMRPSMPLSDSIPDGEWPREETLESDESGSNYSSDARQKKKMANGTRTLSPEVEQEDDREEADEVVSSVKPSGRKVCW